MAKSVLKICCGDFINESRDRRELSVCRELGAKVLVMAKGGPTDRFKEDKVFGFDVLRFSACPLGTRFSDSINKAASVFPWAHYARKIHPDVITAQDLGALSIAWLSNIFRREKAVLIYDSHEFELGRNKKRSKLQLWGIEHLERFLMKRCAFSIMVNDCIADEVQKIHHLKERPVVVRSTPNYWEVDEAVCAERRKEFESKLEAGNFLLMYHGNVMKGRGVESLLDVISKTEKTVAVILGNGEEAYLNELRKRADTLKVGGRVLFKPAVPIDVLWQYAGAADVGMILAPAVVKNHLYSLPNKFFENIQSETPVVCPDYPAMKPIVDQYGIGLTCNPTDSEKVIACVEKMRADRDFYRQCKTNLKTAKRELCWENEKEVLLEAYRKVL